MNPKAIKRVLTSALLATSLASCIDQGAAPAEEAAIEEEEKNGSLPRRTVWLKPGETLPLSVTCDEWYSCDVEFQATPCADWVKSAGIAPDTKLATFSAISACTSGGCATVGSSEGIFYRARSVGRSKRFYDYDKVMMIDGEIVSAQLDFNLTYDGDSASCNFDARYQIAEPIVQDISASKLDKQAKVSTSISLAPNAPASVCLDVYGYYY